MTPLPVLAPLILRLRRLLAALVRPVAVVVCAVNQVRLARKARRKREMEALLLSMLVHPSAAINYRLAADVGEST